MTKEFINTVHQVNAALNKLIYEDSPYEYDFIYDRELVSVNVYKEDYSILKLQLFDPLDQSCRNMAARFIANILNLLES